MSSSDLPQVICPVCGFANRPSFHMCHGCASLLSLDIEVDHAQSRSVAKPSLRRKTLWVVGGLGIIGGLVLFVTMMGDVIIHSNLGRTAKPIAAATASGTPPSITISTPSPVPGMVDAAPMLLSQTDISNSLPFTLEWTNLLSMRIDELYWITITYVYSNSIHNAQMVLPGPTQLLPNDLRGTAGPSQAFGPLPSIADFTSTSIAGWAISNRQSSPSQTNPRTAPGPTRTEVVTYTVRSGDTVYSIARRFNLTPATIYWANPETLLDNPHRLSADMVLNILPTEGVYHVVAEGETVADLAHIYQVAPEALYNQWNDLQEGVPLVAGMRLVIPHGQRPFVVWQLPTVPVEGDGSSSNQSVAGRCAENPDGPPGRGRFDWPTNDQRLSGWHFHDARNPTHIGIDIDLKTGDPVYAADDGVVISAGGWGGSGYGNLVVLDHRNGWQTWYAHLSKINVVCGEQVSAGSVIGQGGSTGWSTGPHLHFETRLEGVPHDPLVYLPAR